MARNMQRLHVNNVTEMVYDWLKESRGPKENKKYDRILLDVPCSNTGVIRRRIDVRWRLKPQDITAQAATQLQLLLSCVHSLATGGVIVYSTCSIDKEENEQVIEKAMAAIPGLQLIETKQTLPHRDGVDGAFAAALRLDRELPPVVVIKSKPIEKPEEPSEEERLIGADLELEDQDLDDEPAIAEVEDEVIAPKVEDEVVFTADSEEDPEEV